MQLYERGLIDLDESINQYLPFDIKNPNFPDRKITVRMLLQHKSSLIDNETAYRSTFTIFTGSPDPEMTLEELARAYFLDGGDLYDQEANFSKKLPGKEFNYSNVAFGLLGYMVEQVSGQAFNVYCTENIFAPLGMQSTGWMSTDINLDKLAVQYDGKTRLSPYSVASYPDGALKTSVKDYSKFLMAMMNGGYYKGQRILKASTVKEMMPENPAENLVWMPDILSTFFIDAKDQYLQGHSGGDPGSATLVGFNADNGNGVIVFMNGAPSLISPSPLLLLKLLNYRSLYKRLVKEAGLF
jgi:CubicO group peptidase (beta-lactamase class C family)